MNEANPIHVIVGAVLVNELETIKASLLKIQGIAHAKGLPCDKICNGKIIPLAEQLRALTLEIFDAPTPAKPYPPADHKVTMASTSTAKADIETLKNLGIGE